MVNGYPFRILIDAGSNYNCLDLTVEKKLRCTFKSTNPQAVTVCNKFKWSKNKYPFEVEVLLISLGACDRC